MTWPKLPNTIPGLAGPIKVDRPVRVERDCPDTIGLWLARERRIVVQSTLKRQVAIQTLVHELIHAAIHDTGICLSHEKEEAICDSAASAMMHVISWALDSGKDSP